MTNTLKQNLRQELCGLIWSSRWHGGFDALAHQSLLIVAAVSGFVSLAVGLATHNGALIAPDNGALIAGILGAVPSLASLLIRQLHCVKAANWHRRRAGEVDALRLRLDYELPKEPSAEALAALSSELRNIQASLRAEWESVTNNDETTNLDPAFAHPPRNKRTRRSGE